MTLLWGSTQDWVNRDVCKEQEHGKKTLFCEIVVNLCLVSKTFTVSEIIGLILNQFENRVLLLNPVLGGMGSVAPLLHFTHVFWYG